MAEQTSAKFLHDYREENIICIRVSYSSLHSGYGIYISTNMKQNYVKSSPPLLALAMRVNVSNCEKSHSSYIV